ncbi:MAG: DUF2520 domain-containing protein [Deltaproteobacteria bacterium]|nr:DUF2520 domain-containing protein [Deltaproteobacteria bacterium]
MSSRTFAVLGAGKVGSALARSLQRVGSVHVYSRTRRASLDAVLRKLPPRALAFLCIPEAAIASVAPVLTAHPHRYVSVSGSATPDFFRGVGLEDVDTFHPLMGFSADGPKDFTGVPVGVSGAGLAALAKRIGAVPFALPADRTLYHAAAVLGGAGVLTAWSAALAMLVEAGVKAKHAPGVLLPIALQALTVAAKRGPRAALTGPVVRKDEQTIARHREAIAQRLPAHEAIYDALLAEMRRLHEGRG